MISQLWCEILNIAKVPTDGVILEVAPGFKSKVGTALSALDFCGEYHIIEPNREALSHSLKEYKAILPQATIYTHRKCLHKIKAGEDIPFQADAILANHALDDMVLAMGTSSEEVEYFFSMNSGCERIRMTRELWGGINQQDLEIYANKTVEKILSFLSRSKPQLTIFSHYEGKTLAKEGINKPNEIGSHVAQALQKKLIAHPLEPYRGILQREGNGSDWVIDDHRNV